MIHAIQRADGAVHCALAAALAAALVACMMSPAGAQPPGLREQLHRATAGELLLCHLKSMVALQGGPESPQAMKEAAFCGTEKGMAEGMAAYRELQPQLGPAARTALRNYMAAWQAAMASSAGSARNPAAQAATRQRIDELWARFALE